MAISAAPGSTRTRRPGRSTSARSSGSRPRPPGAPMPRSAACRCSSSASPASTAPAARPSTSCATAPPAASSSPDQVFNRIHVEDIGRITALAALQKLDGTYNLADLEPAPPQDLVTYAAALMGIAPPPEVPFEKAEMTRDGAELLFRQQARLRRTGAAGARHRAALSHLPRRARRDLEQPRMSGPQPATVPSAAGSPLEGRYVRLEPLGPEHASDLYAASSVEDAEERFRYLFESPPASLAEMEAWVHKVHGLDDPMLFAVVDRTTGRAGGRQALMRIVPDHGVIEIGSIYWGPAHRPHPARHRGALPLRPARLRRARLPAASSGSATTGTNPRSAPPAASASASRACSAST